MKRKEDIYDKALDLFIRQGYDRTPVSRIAKSLSLTKAGLYHYFESKEDLLFEIHDYYLNNYFIPIIDKAEKISDPEARIAYFLRDYTKLLANDAAARVLIHEARRLKPKHLGKVKLVWKRAFELIRNAISEMERSKKGKKMNATFAAFAAIGISSWTFYWFDYSRKESGQELSDVVVEIFLRGLLAKDSAEA